MFKVSWILDFLLGPKLYFDTGDQPTTPEKTTQVSELPDWAKGYAKDTLAKGAALTDINKNPYQTYGGERIAGFQPMQQQSFASAANLQPSAQLGMGTGLAGAAGLGALGTNYQAGRFSGGQFNSNAANQYMNPYMQNVVDVQQREAQRQADIAGTQRNAQAVKSGAFGGSRQAITAAEAARNLALQKGDIQAQGLNTAYGQAANQFNQDMSRRLQAQQMGEQSRQYGAGLGMQGLQTALQSAGQLGQLGQTQYGQETGIIGLQNQLGTQQQQQAQRPLDMAYQDFINQQNYPYKQLGFMSDMIRGLPLGQQTASQVYQGSGSTMGQLAGLGAGAYGLSKMMAEGGLAFADGGVTDPQNVQSILSKLSDQQLQQAHEAALNRRDLNEAQMIEAEIAQRASMRRGNTQIPEGIAPAVTDQFANDMEQNMATGGIVAFADGDVVSDPMGTGASEITEAATAPYGRSFMQWLTREPDWKAKLDAEKKAAPPPAKQKLPQMSPEDMAKIDARNAAIKSGIDIDKEGKVVPPKAAPEKTVRSLEDALAGPKPSKAEVKSAVAQLAEQQGLGKSDKDDVMANALKIREEFDKQNKPILDRLNAAIEAQKPDEQAIKDRGLAQALTQFGFGLAERASKPGARFLSSVSGAAPVIATVAAKTNELIDTQKQNYAKLQLDQAKYEIALAKGDMQTAATLAGQIRQSQQQDKLLQFHIAKAKDDLQMEKAKLASQNAYQQASLGRHETIGSLTRDIMRNEDLPYNKALEKAGRLIRPAGYAADVRAGTSENANLDKALEKIDKKYPLLSMMDPKNPKYAGMKAEYDAEVRAAYARHGGIGAAAPSAGAPSPTTGWGDMRVKP